MLGYAGKQATGCSERFRSVRNTMRNKLRLLPLVLLFILFSCQSINSNRTALGIPSPLVYFSFDDGPDGQGDTTARLLDVLEKYQIRALFCLLGENAERYPDLVRRIHDEGHYIVNHGYSDKWACRMSEGEFRDNLIRGEAASSAALGFGMSPKLYRPHGGFYNSRQEKICIDEGYTIVLVTARVYDAVTPRAKRDKVVRQVVGKIRRQGGGIILLHDARGSHSSSETSLEKNPRGPFDRSWIPETVEEIITVLLDRGFIINSPDSLAIINN
jgi:peptidoglycan/xylan/chitin deacetylase (PgdA/CDA1 family)